MVYVHKAYLCVSEVRNIMHQYIVLVITTTIINHFHIQNLWRMLQNT